MARITIKQMQADVDRHAAELGVTVTADLKNAELSCSDPIDKTMHVGPVKTRLGYFINMHELGHIATTPIDYCEGVNGGDLDLRRKQEISTEIAADKWAIDHLIIPFDDKLHKQMDDALDTFLQAGDVAPPALWEFVADDDLKAMRADAAKGKKIDAATYKRDNDFENALHHGVPPEDAAVIADLRAMLGDEGIANLRALVAEGDDDDDYGSDDDDYPEDE